MKQEITLNISRTSEDGKTYSNTSINASSLDELQRMLSLAGVKSDIEPTNTVAVTSNPNDPLNKLPLIPAAGAIDSDNAETFAQAVDMEEPVDYEEGDLPAEISIDGLEGLAAEMEAAIDETDKALNEMDFDYGHNHKNEKEDYDEYSHKAPGRGNIPVRQINSYGDNPWQLDLNESKLENLAVLAEEAENDEFKSAMKKVIEQDYKLTESEVVTLANIFINLLNDKSPKRFTAIQNVVKTISESIKLHKQYKGK